MDALPSEITSGEQRKTLDKDAVIKDFSHQVEEVTTKVETLKQRLKEVEQYYLTSTKKQLNAPEGSSIQKKKDNEKQIANFIKRQQDAPHREAAAVKRKQELMSQIGTILQQITQHKWAGPFMQPVDVVGLGLHDYFEVIEKPMDFSTIKAKMEAKDGTGYKNVREIYADVTLIFKNAMKYNNEHHDDHVMAKTLLSEFEEKWQQLLPKFDQEEKMLMEEEATALLDKQLAEAAFYAKRARDLSIELDEFDLHLGKLRETILRKCRKISVKEKKWLAESLSRLSPKDLDEAMRLVARCDPTFQADKEEVDLNLDAMSESTLWKLKFFVKEKQQARGNSAGNVVVVEKQKKVIQNVPGSGLGKINKKMKKGTATMSHHPRQISTPVASMKRKASEARSSDEPPAAPSAAVAAKPVPPNQLLAGYLAYEFLTKGTLFGEKWDPSRAEAEAEPESEELQGMQPGQSENRDAKASQSVKPLQHQSYLAVASLLKSDGVHVPGIVNPSQLAQWIGM